MVSKIIDDRDATRLASKFLPTFHAAKIREHTSRLRKRYAKSLKDTQRAERVFYVERAEHWNERRN